MAADAKYKTITDATFKEDVLDSKTPVLVDFWATWCGPCRMIAPIIEELAEEYEGRAVIGKMDVDENQMVPMNFNIRSIPTLLIFKDGQVVDQITGAARKKIIADKLDRVVAQHA